MPELGSLKTRTRRAYEMARLRRALVLSLPALILAGGVAISSNHAAIPLQIGTMTYVVAVGLLWWGRGLGRGVLPGFLYGLLLLGGMWIPRIRAMHGACFGVRVLVGFGGGLLSGLLIARRAARSQQQIARSLSSASIALLTGALGAGWAGAQPVVESAIGLCVAALLVALRSHTRLER